MPHDITQNDITLNNIVPKRHYDEPQLAEYEYDISPNATYYITLNDITPNATQLHNTEQNKPECDIMPNV